MISANSKMKMWHFVCLVIAIIVALMIVHYFSHHKGQNPIQAYTPMGLVSK